LPKTKSSQVILKLSPKSPPIISKQSGWIPESILPTENKSLSPMRLTSLEKSQNFKFDDQTANLKVVGILDSQDLNLTNLVFNIKFKIFMTK